MLRFLVLLRALRHDIALLLFAMLRRDTPRAVKISVLGAVDDMVILPAATSLLVRMLPAQARAEGERRVARYGTRLLAAASVVMILWLILLVWALCKVFA